MVNMVSVSYGGITMKKKIYAMFTALFLISGPLFSQAFVIDLQAIAAAIQNGVTMAQQLEATYNQLRGTYEQIQQTAEQMKSMDMSKLSKKALQSLTGNSDMLEDYLNNLENIYDEKNMKIGNISFSLNDLYNTDVYSKISKDFGIEMGKSIGSLTAQQLKEFANTYGIDYEQYLRMAALAQETGKKAKEIKAMNGYSSKVTDSLRQLSDDLASGAGDSSEVATLQKSLLAANATVDALVTVSDTVSNISDLLASQAAQQNEQLQKEIESSMDTANAAKGQPEYMKDSTGEWSNYRGFNSK